MIQSNLKIIDCNCHPTISGKWEGSRRVSSFEDFDDYVIKYNLSKAFAVGLHDFELYDHKVFMDRIKNLSVYDRIVPIAGFSPSDSKDIYTDLKELKNLGFKGVKIHPMTCHTSLFDHEEKVVKLMKAAYDLDMIVMWCTFLSREIGLMPDGDPFFQWIKILKACPPVKLILVHGGVTRLLLYAELARFNKNILLDLSYTICKFRGSSLDSDIQFLLRTLDQRLCLGSDYPEYTIEDVTLRMNELKGEATEEQMQNVCFNNLNKFLNSNLS